MPVRAISNATSPVPRTVPTAVNSFDQPIAIKLARCDVAVGLPANSAEAAIEFEARGTYLDRLRTQRVASPARTGRRFLSSTGLATLALLAASTGSARAQSEWTGAVTSNWFLSGNWIGGFPRQTIDGNINTVTPNSTVIADPGAEARDLSVGPNGTGMLTIQTGGTLTSFSIGTVGNLPGGRGTVTVTDPGSRWQNNSTLVVGGQGIGTLTIQDRGTVTSSGASVGLSARSIGTVTVTGPGSNWSNGPSGGLNIGSFGTGTLTIANGGRVINITAANTANIGSGIGSNGAVTVTGAGSTWSNNLGVNIGNRGTGTLTIADGGVVTGPIVIATNAGATGTLNIGAGAGAPAVASGALTSPSLAFGAGTGTLNFNHTSLTYVFAPAITGNGTVNVFAGTTTLRGANRYGGETNVEAGTLRAGALNTFSPNSSVTVARGGTLDLNGFDQTIGGLANAGLVSMGAGAAPSTVLTTTGYTGRGGTVAMNVFLGADNSPADRLVINGGQASGNSFLQVTNVGGGGAVTTGNGITVVDTTNGGTTTTNAFALDGGEVAAGPYLYTLFRSSVDGSNSQAWYLRSTLPPPPSPPSPPPPPGPPGPPPPPSPPGPPIPNIRAEVSLFAALPAMAALYGSRMIDTLHERVGEEEQLRGRADLSQGYVERRLGPHPRPPR